MKLTTQIFWLTLAILGLLILGMIHARGAVPPVPKLPRPVLRSPKDAAAQPKVAPPPAIVVPWINNKALVWEGNTNTGYVIESRTNLTGSWSEVGRVTNTFRFPINCTNACGFYRVGAFWP